MKTIKIGNLEVREDLKADRKELKKRFSKFLSDAQLEELAKKLKKNDVRGTKSKNKQVRIKKST